MNGRLSKAMRRYFRKEWKRYYVAMCDLPLINRIQLAIDIIFKSKL